MINYAGNVQYTAVLTHVFLGQHRVQTPPCPLQFAGPTFHTVRGECHEQSAWKGSGKKQVQAGSRTFFYRLVTILLHNHCLRRGVYGHIIPYSAGFDPQRLASVPRKIEFLFPSVLSGLQSKRSRLKLLTLRIISL